MKNWKVMKEAGLNVVPSVRIIDDNTVAMTNLTRDGSKIYDKAFLLALYQEHQKANYQRLEKANIKPDTIDLMYLDLVANRRDEITTELNRQMGLLDNVWYNFSRERDDTFSIRMHPNGMWDMLLIDIDTAYSASIEEGTQNQWIPNEFNYTMDKIVICLQDPTYREPPKSQF